MTPLTVGITELFKGRLGNEWVTDIVGLVSGVEIFGKCLVTSLSRSEVVRAFNDVGDGGLAKAPRGSEFSRREGGIQ